MADVMTTEATPTRQHDATVITAHKH